jgi:hypothetical protein
VGTRSVGDFRSDSEDELQMTENECSIQEKLADWAIKYNISHDAFLS